MGEAAVVRRLTLETVTRETWSAFGQVPGDFGTEYDTASVEFVWNDGGVNFIAHSNDEISFSADGFAICELLNRHDTHTQTLMPFDGDAYAVVAPAGVDFSRPDHFDTVRAFLLPRYSVVNLAIGTWHWGPYPIAAETLRIFNVQGRGFVNDNGIAWLTRDLGVSYEVEIR
jgi:ureidoglycolate hydrolase